MVEPCSPIEDLHRAFVHAREGDGRLFRRPPVAREPAHLLLGDELGDSVADRTGPFGGNGPFGAGSEVQDVEVLVPDIAGETAQGRDLRVGCARAAGLQRRDGARVGVGEIEAAASGNQQAPRLLIPVIGNHARHRRDPLTLPAALFRLGEVLAGGFDRFA